jgi:hypothetical protein
MIGYMAYPYPEELYYSVLARTLKHHKMEDRNVFKNYFFDGKNTPFKVHFASGLRKMTDLTNYSLTADYIIQHHTNFPLIEFFFAKKEVIK